jgi:Fur family zinc uptake transcriptional regulator
VTVFLICEACGAAAEAEAAGLGGELARLAAGVGFSPRAQIVELAGTCGACAASTR